MAAPLLRGPQLLRQCHRYRQMLESGSLLLRRWCTAVESSRPDNNTAPSTTQTTIPGGAKDPPKSSRSRDDSDFRDYGKWKKKEAKIREDIKPTISLAKELIHSNRYMDGEPLSTEDEETVVKRLLAYHPRSEDKIGCGLDSIMVDWHPQFRRSRCLFVVRVDGGWIDFSYQKCVQAYIRDKYPSHAEKYIKQNFWLSRY